MIRSLSAQFRLIGTRVAFNGDMVKCVCECVLGESVYAKSCLCGAQNNKGEPILSKQT